MIDEWLEQVEQLRRAGAVIVLRWDGKRSANPYTVVVLRADTDFVFRVDTAIWWQRSETALPRTGRHTRKLRDNQPLQRTGRASQSL